MSLITSLLVALGIQSCGFKATPKIAVVTAEAPAPVTAEPLPPKRVTPLLPPPPVVWSSERGHGVCQLKVTSDPFGAELFINGAPRGKTDFFSIVPCGETLTVTVKGHAREPYTARVKINQPTKLHVLLTPPPPPVSHAPSVVIEPGRPPRAIAVTTRKTR